MSSLLSKTLMKIIRSYKYIKLSSITNILIKYVYVILSNFSFYLYKLYLSGINLFVVHLLLLFTPDL